MTQDVDAPKPNYLLWLLLEVLGIGLTIRVLHPGTAEFQATDPRRLGGAPVKDASDRKVPEPYSVWPIAGYNSRAATNPL